jgi:ABC transport system ATP-binding/permease protein
MLFGLPMIGTLLAVLASSDGLRPGRNTAQVLSILVTVAALTGAALTYLDLVHDRSVLQRDWRVGMTAGTLVLAKAIVYGAICAALSGIVALIYSALRDPPPRALGIAPVLLLFLAIVAVMVASMGLGLLVSSFARTLERAATYNTLLAVLQVALNGALFKVPLWCTVVLPARLGLGTVASYVDLNRYRVGGLHRDTLWQSGEVWVPLTLLGMALVAVWSIVVAAWRTERGWRA